MPANYIAIKKSCVARKKKTKDGKPLTEKEKNVCAEIAVEWWVKKHEKPFPKEDVVQGITEDKLELREHILNSAYWDKHFTDGAIWGQLNDPDNSFNAVDEILSKIGAEDNYIRVKIADASKYKRFKITEIKKDVIAILGMVDKTAATEIQAYLFKKKDDAGDGLAVKDIVKWIREQNSVVSADELEWAVTKEVDELFEHQLNYDVVCEARVLDMADIDKEALATAGITELDKDLMGIEFKLVHANTNSNKDTFLSDELQTASVTPKYKPINWQHTDRIIGVMLDSVYTDSTENADTKTIVEDPYLKVTGVIYKYKFPAYAAEMLKRHKEGNLTFSMETWFDAAECSICEGRFSKQSEYCEHLKDRHSPASTASRILRGLTFSGAGVVDYPADEDADSISIGNKSNLEEDDNMPKTENQVVFESEKELNTFVAEEVAKEVKKLQDKEGVAALKTSLTEASDQIKTLETTIAAKDTELEAAKEVAVTVQKEFDGFKAELEKDTIAEKRVAELIEAGIVFPEDTEKKDKIVMSIRAMDKDAYVQYKEILVASIKKEDTTEETNTDVDTTEASVDVPNPKDNVNKKFAALTAILDKTTKYEKTEKEV